MPKQSPSLHKPAKRLATQISLIFLLTVVAPFSVRGKSPREAPQRVNLSPQIAEGDVQHAKILFELDGTLALKSETKDPVNVPVQAKAQVSYDEKIAQGPTPTQPWARSTIRAYKTAKATIKFRKRTVTPQLREDRQLIASSAQSPEAVVLFSPLGPLTRDELDLIDVPANSAIINDLLPRKTVGIGETWKLESALLPAILGRGGYCPPRHPVSTGTH